MRIRRREEEPVEVQMAPLIDCVFLLLIFFLVATTMKRIQKELPLRLPAATIGVDRPERTDLLILSIDAQGQKYVGPDPVTTSALLDRLAAAAAANPSQSIRIDADENTPYRHIVEVIEAAQFYGLRNVGLRIRTPYDRRYD